MGDFIRAPERNQPQRFRLRPRLDTRSEDNYESIFAKHEV